MTYTTGRAAARGTILMLALCLAAASSALAQPAPFEYRLSFPTPEHRWMQVEARFSGLPEGTAEIRMSRTSPGRYALHEFVKNVFEVTLTDGAGKVLVPTRPSLHQWNVTGHGGTVVVTYKVFGDRSDGTYLSVDAAHAHMNMPATVMFVRGQMDRRARVTLVQPPGRAWKVATQLFPTPDPLVFTAPNIYYLMDSPTEFSNFTLRSFSIDDGVNGPQTFRIALHHDGTDAEADLLARDVEKTVREASKIFGELPKFDGGVYTFLADYLPWVDGDGMEHRNSTVVSGRGALRNPDQRQNIMGTISHEFFHAWNMERLRAKAIEPFDFEAADVSEELWFGEGFTNYFDGLILERAGLMPVKALLGDFAGVINTVTLSPGRQIRSAVEMSRLAPFVDAATSIDRTAWPNLFISYYTYGEAIATGLDLTLRSRFPDLTLDDFMGAMWRKFGKTGKAYTLNDVSLTLGEVTRDPAFAAEYVRRYIAGREVPDYAALFARVGFLFRPARPGAAWLGDLSFEDRVGALTISAATLVGQPAYRAGLDRGDVILTLGGRPVGSGAALASILARHRPGDTLAVAFESRGQSLTGQVILETDPRMELVPAEAAGAALTPGVQDARRRWLASRAGTQGAPR